MVAGIPVRVILQADAALIGAAPIGLDLIPADP